MTIHPSKPMNGCMSTSYIPAKESQLITWLANFSTLITAAPATYGLLAADATAIAAQNTAYSTAYNAAKAPGTRSPTTVAAKNTARVNMLAIVRAYAQTIAKNAGVSPTNKIALGINPQTSTPTPVPAPTTTPNLTVQATVSNGIVIRYRDSLASPSVKAKPPGAVSCQIFGIATAGTNPATPPAQWALLASTSKSPLIIDTTAMTSGQKLFLAARWITRKGLLGDFGATVSSYIP